MKKYNTLFLLLLFFTTLISSCQNDDKHADTVNLTIKLPMLTMVSTLDASIATSEDFIKKAWNAFAAQYKKYPISANIIGFKQEKFDTAIDDCFDTKDAADLMYADFHTSSSYIHTGRLVPLDGIISEEVRKDIADSFWEAASAANGKIYLFPFLTRPNILVYNKQIFLDCGLAKFVSEESKIQAWSMKDWDFIFRKLREKLPQNSYPMMMYANSYMGDLHTMLQLRCKGSKFFNQEGMIHLSTPEGVAALQWIKDNYDRKYYPPHAENLGISDCTGLFANKQLAVCFWNIGLLNYFKDSPNNLLPFRDYGFVNFPSADSKGAATAFISGFLIFDNGDSKKIEIAQDFVKYVIETPQWADYSIGSIPCMKSVMKRHPNMDTLTRMLSQNSSVIVDYQNNSPNWLAVRHAFYPHIDSLLTGEETPEQAAKGIDRDCNKALLIGYSKSKLHN